MRVFPLSNKTEIDVWEYIRAESIPKVPLYFTKERPVVVRGGTLIMVDDDRHPLDPGEKPRYRMVRFRTLGCYPLTGAVESNAKTLDEIVTEMVQRCDLARHLEAAETRSAADKGAFRFPVQLVNRPDLIFRGDSGTIASGEAQIGDPVRVAGFGVSTPVSRIITPRGDAARGSAGDAVALNLADDIDISVAAC